MASAVSDPDSDLDREFIKNLIVINSESCLINWFDDILNEITVHFEKHEDQDLDVVIGMRLDVSEKITFTGTEGDFEDKFEFDKNEKKIESMEILYTFLKPNYNFTMIGIKFCNSTHNMIQSTSRFDYQKTKDNVFSITYETGRFPVPNSTIWMLGAKCYNGRKYEPYVDLMFFTGTDLENRSIKRAINFIPVMNGNHFVNLHVVWLEVRILLASSKLMRVTQSGEYYPSDDVWEA